MGFTKAVKEQAKLRLALIGVSGSGKTYTALQLSKLMGGRTALIDSEHGSASKYAHLFDFDTDSLSEFSLDTYLRKISEAEAAGYQNLIIDSLSHAWIGKGGALETVDNITAASRSKNAFNTGWREVSPKQTRLIDAIVGSTCNVIATMRAKAEYVLEDDGGRKVPKKVGMAAVQRNDLDFEFDLAIDMTGDGHYLISKSRCDVPPALKGTAGSYSDIPAVSAALKAWLSSGVAPQPRVVPDASAAEKAEQSIRDATSKAELEAVGEKLKAQPAAVRDALRPLYGKRLAEFA